MTTSNIEATVEFPDPITLRVGDVFRITLCADGVALQSIDYEWNATTKGWKPKEIR